MLTLSCISLKAYTIAKYGMSMCVLGMAEELKPVGIAVNGLWPRTGRSMLVSVYGQYVRSLKVRAEKLL